MTATRKWSFGAVAVAMLLLAGGWFLLISPQRAEVADLKAQTDAQLATNAADRTELEVLKQQNKELPEKQAELAQLRTKIPQSADLPMYIRELQDLSRRAGVALTTMVPSTPITLGTTPGTEGPLTPDALAALNVDVTVAGRFEGIQKFVNDLENADRYTLLSGVTIADEEDQPGETGSNGQLTATFNARVYLVPNVDPAVTTTTPAPTPAP
ncbi:MAG TPA: type 4a pilus biogenesis protein PilO [Actinomycetes bacterium]|nr:type 4a pilus biogenesis protein PilO [Actinomycetes bacterium]